MSYVKLNPDSVYSIMLQYLVNRSSFRRFRPLLVGNLFQLHQRIKFGSRMNIVIIQSESQRMSYNIHKITTVFELHALTLSIMHCFNCLA